MIKGQETIRDLHESVMPCDLGEIQKLSNTMKHGLSCMGKTIPERPIMNTDQTGVFRGNLNELERLTKKVLRQGYSLLDSI